MKDDETVVTKAIAERQVAWTPKGWAPSSRKLAIVRDGKIEQLDKIEDYFVTADPDGCIEFFQAIKRVMAETAKV